MDRVAAQIAEDSGPLTHVSAEMMPARRFRELVFTFAYGTLIVSCNHDTDEIVLQARLGNSPSNPTGASILDDLIGMRIECAWELKNHRGFIDGLQLRFIDDQGREDCRQFEVAASGMDMRRVLT